MEVKHIIFDLDGTLWDTTELSAKAYSHALSEDGRCSLNVTPYMIKQEFGKTVSMIANDLFPEFDKTTQTELMKKCDCLNTSYLEDSDSNMLYPNVRETLASLCCECRLYIVSNCQAGYIEMFLNKYGLEPYIADTECFGNTGKGKAENIQQLMTRNHINAAIYVGDTEGDYESATKAGIPFIFASYGYGNIKQSAHSINCFSELINYVTP